MLLAGVFQCSRQIFQTYELIFLLELNSLFVVLSLLCRKFVLCLKWTSFFLHVLEESIQLSMLLQIRSEVILYMARVLGISLQYALIILLCYFLLMHLYLFLHYKLKENLFYISSLYFSPKSSPVLGTYQKLSKPEMTGIDTRNFNVTNLKKLSKQRSTSQAPSSNMFLHNPDFCQRPFISFCLCYQGCVLKMKETEHIPFLPCTLDYCCHSIAK